MNKKLKKMIIYALVIGISIISIPSSYTKAKVRSEAAISSVKKISLEATNLYLELDQSDKLTVKFISKTDAKREVVEWTSSDSNIVTVQEGEVFAKGIGTAYVYANCDSCIAYCKVTVVRYNPVRAVQYRNYEGYEGIDLETVTKAAEVIDKNIRPEMTDEQKVIAILDYLLSNTKYDYVGEINNTVSNSLYGIIGPLIDNNGVRDGYVYTFKYLLDILKISNRLYVWHEYMWNQVYYNEKRYSIDLNFLRLYYNANTRYTPVASLEEYNQKITVRDTVDYEQILYNYRDDSYSGNEAAVLKVKELMVTIDANFAFTDLFELDSRGLIVNTINENESFIPDKLPGVKGNDYIYVSSMNTRADGTGISYPVNRIDSIDENLYLYCIWTVNIAQTKVTLTGSKVGFTAKWTEVGGCSNYQLRYSFDSTMKKAVTKRITGKKASITGLKKNTTYYVQVRASITDDNGQVTYGKWSAKKKVTTK